MHPFILLLILKSATLALARVHRSISKYQVIEPEITFLGPRDSIYDERYEWGAGRDAIRVRFQAFGDNIDFVASRTAEPAFFGTKLEVRGLEGPHHVDISDFSPDFYEMANSSMSAFLHLMDDGHCIGKVSVGATKYYLEPTHTYFRNAKSRPSVIVYKDSDVRYPRMTGCTHKPRVPGWSLTKRQQPVDPFANFNADMQDEGVPPDFIMFKSPSDKTEHVACEVKMVGDVNLYQWLQNDYYKTAAYLYMHAKVSDRILRKTNLGPKIVRLVVKNIVVFTNANDPQYPFRVETPEFIKYLDHFAAVIDTEHCLAIVICAKRFETRAIGHAYLAYADNRYPGGICSPPSTSHEGVRVTYNKLAITALNSENQHLPLALSLRTFAHEIGHSFGSPHDPQDNMTCSPGGKIGYYLLYDFAQYGGILSETFSPCSSSVISEVVKNRMHCLKPVQPYCGNGIREKGEECDCGDSAICDFVDKCCIPKGGVREYPAYPECTYRRFSYFVCSGQEDACCTPDCVVGNVGKICSREASGCLVGKCDGVTKDCPQPGMAPDGTPCMSGSRTCSRGVCTSSSVCVDNGFTDCTCSGEHSCKLCCSNGQQCTPMSTLGIATVENSFLPFGTSCGDSMQCDTEGRCIHSESRPSPGIVTSSGKDKKWILKISIPVVVLVILLFIVVFFISRRKRSSASGRPGKKRMMKKKKFKLPK